MKLKRWWETKLILLIASIILLLYKWNVGEDLMSNKMLTIMKIVWYPSLKEMLVSLNLNKSRHIAQLHKKNQLNFDYY